MALGISPATAAPYAAGSELPSRTTRWAARIAALADLVASSSSRGRFEELPAFSSSSLSVDLGTHHTAELVALLLAFTQRHAPTHFYRDADSLVLTSREQ